MAGAGARKCGGAASPDLARQVARICAGDGVPEAEVRRAVLPVVRYLLRGTGRATPFGLLAGVAPACVGSCAAIRTGTGHKAVARADAAWLASVTETLEADDDLLARLTVVTSNLIQDRDRHLVISHRPSESAGKAPELVRVRATRPVRAALETARSPILTADLIAKLAAEFPSVTADVITRLVARLVGQRLLITSLRAPVTSPDPLAVLLAELEAAVASGDARLSALRAVRATLVRHNTAPTPAAAREERRRAAAMMTAVHRVPGPALAVDLRLDWDLIVPETVAAEAAAAAGVLARLARRPALSAGWAAWHARFLDRYGPGAVVPVLDVVDDVGGLGFPAGYLGSPYAEDKSPVTDRDKALLRLAHQALVCRQQEVTLDDALVEELAVTPPDAPVQPSAELTVRVHAASVPTLNDGCFTMHVLGVSRCAGTVAGRFLHLLRAADRGRMLDGYAGLPGVHRDSVVVQISAVPLYVKSWNVARAPQAARLLISVGEHRADRSGELLPVSDLAVTADARRLHLVSLSRRLPVHTILPSAVDLTVHTQPLARFLLEAPVALAAPCAAFDWGAASALPFVPALRYGRAVLSPARWVLTAADLPGREACWSRWDDALTAWARQVGLPRCVHAGDGDRCLTLDLTEASHRALLRTELDRAGRVRLRAAPSPGDLGWADNRPHEITIPVAADGPRADPVRSHGEVTARGQGYPPGCGGRFYLKLYAPRDLQDAVLTRYLPDLPARLGCPARWWYIRYDDPGPHLRLRVIVGPEAFGAAAEAAGAWTSELRDCGLVSRVSWDTYYPEAARFGGTTVMGAAEEFFAADSAAAVAQLAALAVRDGLDARALTAASMVDIAAAVTGDAASAMRWLTGHTRPDSVAPSRPVYNQTVALVCADGPAGITVLSAVADAWLARRAAVGAYGDALERAGTISLTDLLPDLLHLHHARIAGPSVDAERGCLHLARAAALSWIARARAS